MMWMKRGSPIQPEGSRTGSNESKSSGSVLLLQSDALRQSPTVDKTDSRQHPNNLLLLD